MERSKFKKEFSKLLNDAIFPSDTSNEEYYKQLMPIDNLVRSNTPSKLFRYRSCNELNIDSFDKDTIWAVNPSKFNDPHDSLFFADRDYLYNSVRFGFSAEFRIRVCLRILMKLFYGYFLVVFHCQMRRIVVLFNDSDSEKTQKRDVKE